MDAAEDWNGLGDYSLFLPEDSFNLFGEYDLDLGLNGSILPALDEASATFDMAGWDRIETMVPALPGLDVTLPTSGEPHDLIPNPEAELQASKHTSISSPSSARSPISEVQSSTDGFSASGNKVEHQPKSASRNGKFLTAFSVESGKEIRLHTRKRFSKEQRRVVALNRIIGVCLHCRLRKVACNDGIPCNRCVKRAGSISSGQEICMRRSLVATRFDHIDLIRIASMEYMVNRLPLPAEPELDGSGYIWFPGSHNIYDPEAYIKVPITHLKQDGFQRRRVILTADYYSGTYHDLPNINQVIAPESVPSTERLLQAYLTSRRNVLPEHSPFARLSKAFRDFAESYCNSAAELPLKGLLSKIVKLQRLFNIYRSLPVIKSAPCTNDGDGDGDIVSTAIWLQLRLSIGKGIKATETDVLTEIDRMIQSKSGIGRQNPLATWAALWVLVLSYKDYMICCKASWRYGQDPEVEKIYNLNEHLYNMLTSIYAALYKTTSPLTLDWRSNEVAVMLGNDSQIINLFCNIKTELFWFHAYAHELFPEDILFKTLILDNEQKLANAHIKAAQRQGII